MKIDPNQLVGGFIRTREALNADRGTVTVAEHVGGIPLRLEIAARLIAGMESGPREQYMEGHRKAAYWGLERAAALIAVYNQTAAHEVAGSLYADEFTDIVFDGPPSHESGRFVEVEDHNGRSVNVGEWVESGDGYWRLRLRVPAEQLAASGDVDNVTAGEVAGG